MTLLAPRTLLVVLLLLLASVGTATAECAWVVWQHIDFIQRLPSAPPSSRWGIGEITDSRTECEKKIEVSVNDDVTKTDPAWATTVDRRPGMSTTVRSVHKERGLTTVTSYRCLPDTVDPRGPKGQ